MSRMLDKYSVDGESGCWVWTGPKFTHGGYGRVNINRKAHRAHRLSWETVNGPVPSGMVVMHKCDRPACINPDHLAIGTQFENMRDMYAKGRGRPGYVAGEKVGTAKLRAEQARDIRTRRMSSRQFAKFYGVSQRAVISIWRGKTWKTA